MLGLHEVFSRSNSPKGVTRPRTGEIMLIS